MAVKPEVQTSLANALESEGRIKGETRKTYWRKLNPAAKFDSVNEFAEGLAKAIAKAGFVDPKEEKALAGLLLLLGAGNQSQLRQLMESEAEKIECPF